MPDQPPVERVTPGLQLVHRDGRVEPLTHEPMQAPNDLVVAPDGTVYFTDPGYPRTEDRRARIMALRPDGTTELVAGGFVYTNGIAVDLDGTTLVVVEDLGLLRIPDRGRGAPEWIVERCGERGPDGVCLDVDGRLYAAAKEAGGVRVLDRAGRELEFLDIPGGGHVTNCCFGGDDLRTLFGTEVRTGRIVAWGPMPTPGLAAVPWPVG
jgi:gluconolactonase